MLTLRDVMDQGLYLEDVQRLAREHGLPTSRTKGELIDELLESGELTAGEVVAYLGVDQIRYFLGELGLAAGAGRDTLADRLEEALGSSTSARSKRPSRGKSRESAVAKAKAEVGGPPRLPRATRVIRIPFKVSDRFGEIRPGARVEAEIQTPLGPRPKAIALAQSDGRGSLSFRAPLGSGRATIRFSVAWTDPEGVVWGFRATVDMTLEPLGRSAEIGTRVEQGFSITSRIFPQPGEVAEILIAGRKRLGLTATSTQVLLAFDEARDSLLSGLPNASAAISGKTLEASVVARGKESGWPIEKWARARSTLGMYLAYPEVERAVKESKGEGFYRLLVATNVPRILAAHETGSRIHMDEARALLRSVAQLLDAWFSSP